MLLQGWVDDAQYANGNRVAALYDYVRIYSWPTGRRLDDGTFLFLQRTRTPAKIVPRISSSSYKDCSAFLQILFRGAY